MSESGLSILGQYTPLSISLSLNIFFIISYIKGFLISRAHYQDQVKISDSWQSAWEKSEDTKHDQAELLKKLIVTSDTMERVLNAFPRNNTTTPEDGDSA